MINKIQHFLIENNKTLSVCESITGGALSSKLISKSGASNFFQGSLVLYNDEIKSKILGIDINKIKELSAVSETVAHEMAKSTKKIFNSDYVISTTGNAGPKKYDEISKTGQVFITLITPIKSITKEYSLDGERLENIKKTVDFAINLLHKNLSI
tara:strand:- start:42 stop:506 length:465 start_codon:yes stop_codon:yes gene_type:complete